MDYSGNNWKTYSILVFILPGEHAVYLNTLCFFILLPCSQQAWGHCRFGVLGWWNVKVAETWAVKSLGKKSPKLRENFLNKVIP